MVAENSMTGEDVDMAYDLMPYTQSFSMIAHVTTNHGDASDYLALQPQQQRCEALVLSISPSEILPSAGDTVSELVQIAADALHHHVGVGVSCHIQPGSHGKAA